MIVSIDKFKFRNNMIGRHILKYIFLVLIVSSTISVYSQNKQRIGNGNSSQQLSISGKVTDSSNEPMAGVTVLVKGTSIGTITDINGNYSFAKILSNSLLQISFIGMKKVEIPVNNKSIINVQLDQETVGLDDVVVVAYGTQRKSHLTGSVSSLKADKLDEIPVARVDQALQGKIAGVQIQNVDPQAGEAPVIRVRGMGSVSADNAPLVVIDGVPTPDGLSMVSMGDVESVEVLKDAASAALYGSRAAGGVILVTTKSGNVDKPKYNFKMYTGVRNTLKLPDMISTDQYIAQLYKDAALRQQDPSVDGTTATMVFNKITDNEKSSYLVLHNLDNQPTNWLQEGLNSNGSSQSYQLSASGGNKNTKYFISANYINEQGVMKHSSFDKYTFRAKFDTKISKAVTIGVNFTPMYSRQEKPAVDLTDFMRFPSWLPIRHNTATAALTGKVAGDYAQPSDFNGITLSGVGYNNETWNVVGVSPLSSGNQNPVSVSDRTRIFTDNYRLQSSMYISVDLLQGLQFKTSNSAYVSYKEYNEKEQTSASKAGNPNQLTRQTVFHTELLSENTLNYTKRIGEHEISALLGFTMQKTNDELNQIVATNFPDEQMLSFNLASQFLLNTPSIPGITSFYYNEGLVSYLGRLNYTFKGKYLASLSLRSDGSTKFAEGHQWGTFPAGSIGWRISEEDFLKDFKLISNFKIRASYGLTGNNKIPQYSYMNSINTSNYAVGSSTGTLQAGMASNSSFLGNPDITWEQTGEANYGIDLGLFNNRFNLSVEYYNSNTIQLLLQQPAMDISGHQTYWNNIGKVNNKGLEIELSTTNFSSKQFTWKTTANLSTNKNLLLNYGDKQKELNTGERSEVYAAIVGQPAIQFFGYKTNGVYTTFKEVADAKAMTDVNGNPFTYTKYAPILGGVKVVNTNGDNTINSDDRVVLGNPFPDFTWGITNTFTCMNFDLSFLIQGVQGGKIINGNAYYSEQLRLNTAYTTNHYVSPMFPGDGKTVYSITTAGADLMLTDYCLEDGSYAALRDLTLGYKIPKKIVKLVGLGEFRAYFSAQNLIYLMASNYRGINPEARIKTGNYTSPLIDGYQRGSYPLNKTFTVGIDITF